MILTALILAAIVAFIVDYSGIVLSLQKLVNVILYKGKANPGNISLKPFSCSLCMSFWTVLIYALCMTGWPNWIECLALASMAGFSAGLISQSLFTLRTVFQSFLAWITRIVS